MPIYKSKLKKDGKQGYRVCINFTDKNGVKRRIERAVYGATEAKQAERELLAEYSGSASEPSARKTVKDLFDEYMAAKKHELRASSLDKSRRILVGNILPLLGNVRLDRLNAPALQNWKNSIAERGIAVSTQQAIYSELRALLNYGVRMEYFPKNPLTAVGNFKEKDFTPPGDKLHYYTPEQFGEYIAAARRTAEETNTVTAWGNYLFFAIAYCTGLRKGEINALKWSDIDGEILHVRRSVTQKVKGESIVETLPKNKTSYRDIKMPAPLLKVLDEHLDRQKQNGGWSEDFRVCGGEKVLSDTGIENANRKFADRAGLPHIRIHDFRHSHASLLANEGINIQEIARRLGHSKIEQTWNTYAHLYPREEDRAVAVVNKILL
ncbi:MAG: site-specific integrase [Clostridia bacterium]|nr:site-specific integrase [Clostridia bacterium]